MESLTKKHVTLIVILCLVIITIVTAYLDLTRGTTVTDMGAGDTEVVDDGSETRTQYFFTTHDQFDVSEEVELIASNATADIAEYQALVTNNPSITKQVPYRIDTHVLTSAGLIYRDLYNEALFPVASSLLVYAENDLFEITQELTARTKGDVLPPIQRGEGVTPVMMDESFTFPPYQVTRAYIAAEILALQQPDQAALYQAAADEFAVATIAYGYHLRSDVEASKALVAQYMQSVANSATFADWVSALRAEVQ